MRFVECNKINNLKNLINSFEVLKPIVCKVFRAILYPHSIVTQVESIATQGCTGDDTEFANRLLLSSSTAQYLMHVSRDALLPANR